MNHLSDSAFRMLPLLSVLIVVVTGSSIVLAEDEKRGDQERSSVSGATSGGTTQPGSGDVKERGIQQFAPRAGTGPTTTPGVMAPEAIGFKCSPNTGRCNCNGATDCKFMKEVVSRSCGPITCTGSGSTQTCACTIKGF